MLHARNLYYAESYTQEALNFTATGQSAAKELVGGQMYFAVQVVGVGGVPTAWDVRIEGSLDGSNWTQLSGLQHQTSSGNGATIYAATTYPVRFARVNVANLTLGPAASINVYWRAA